MDSEITNTAICKRTTTAIQNNTQKEENRKKHSHYGRSPREPQTKSPPTEIYISTLNTRTLKNEEIILELEHALTKIKWDILGISEVRRNYEAITHRKSNMILCHGAAENSQYGIGFCIKNKWKNHIEEFKPINVRIASLTLKLNPQQKMKIIQVHAPTSESSQENIENFYKTLEDTIEETSDNKYQIIIMGDFNAKIGMKQQGEESIIGNSHYGNRNPRGELLVNFASQYQLKIGNSFFKKPEERKWTWQSPAGYKNEIDFILTNKLKQFTNIEVLSNFEFITDHRMVRATIKQNTKSNRAALFNNIPNRETINHQGDKLKEQLSKKINQISNSLETLKTQEIYDVIEETIIKSAKELKTKHTKKHNKFAEDTMQLIRKRTYLERQKRKSPQDKIELAEIRKLVQKYIRRDVKQYEYNTIIEIMEESLSTKKLRKSLGDGTPWIQKLEKNNELKFSRSKILHIATQYYSNLYASTLTNAENSTTKQTQTETVPHVLYEEIELAIKELKNNKCPGEDKITNEIIKIGKSELIPPLLILFNKILTTEEIPSQWRKSQIILLFKKGSRTDIGNYRPISLIPTICKIFTKIIQRRIANTLELFQAEEQAGFRKNRSTIDHLHVVNQLIEKANEYRITLYMCFVDYNKAFDSLEHTKIWEALEKANVEQKYIQVIKQIYKDNTASIQLEREGESFPVGKGVRQGDPLSPDLFNCTLETVIQPLDWEEKDFGININGKKITNLRFADDVVLIAKTAEELQQQLIDLNHSSKRVGLTINHTKTKIITNYYEHPISIESTKIGYVKDYIYLGQLISFKNRLDKEINRRIANAWKKFWSLKKIFKNKISLEIKRKTFDMCVSSVISYGCQTWAATEKHIHKIRVCQNRMEKSMLGLTWKDKIPIHQIKQKMKIADITSTIKSLKWSWVGHIMRKTQGWTREITDWIPLENKRNRGRQNKRWEDEFKREAGSNWANNARNRDKWKLLGEAYVQKDINHISTNNINV